MKQLFLERGSAQHKQTPTPDVTPNSVLVKVHYSFISTGTEGATLTASGKSLFQKFISTPKVNIEKVKGAVKENGLIGTLALIKSKKNQVIEIGYSCTGQIEAVGEQVSGFAVGDYVACAGAGIANHAEFVLIPQNLAVKLPDATHLKEASLTTIGAIALQGIRRADLRLGEKVCVFGLGLIGQLTVQLAKQSGCEVFGIDIDDSKLALAAQLGCDHVYNARETDIVKDIAFSAQHTGVDATIITAASSDGDIIQSAMELTRRKGKVVLVGDVKIDFDRNPFYTKEIDFLISCSYGPGRYDPIYEHLSRDYPYAYVRWTENRNLQLFANLVQQNKINVAPLIKHEIEFEHAAHAYETLKRERPLGIVLKYIDEEPVRLNPSRRSRKLDLLRANGEINISCCDKDSSNQKHGEIKTSYYDKDSSNQKHREIKTSYYDKDSSNQKLNNPVRPEERALKSECLEGSTRTDLNLALIGAGGFAKVKLLPLISKIKNVSIDAIIDANPTNALNTATQYNAHIHHTDYTHILKKNGINTVVIATPHALHAEQTLACLRSGKAVFVEKPAATTFEQLEELKSFFKKNPECKYGVDFNRSFAPFITEIKQVLAHRTTSLIAHYRMNAGYIPNDHWIQSTRHGRRIIGEACHIFELFCFLTDAKPTSISVETIDTPRADLNTTDNFSVQIRFDDGSCCTLLYTALGNTGLNKERMELFFDGKSVVMNDYKELTGYGLPKSFNKKTKSPDKGHAHLITKFMLSVQTGAPLPLSFDRIITATELSLKINQLAQGKI